MSYLLSTPTRKIHFRAFWDGFWNGISFFRPLSYSPSHKELEEKVRKIMNEVGIMGQLGDTECMKMDTEQLKTYFEDALIQTCNELPEKGSPAKP